MATNYPTSLDSFTNPTSSSTLNSPSHAAQHANANDAIEAIETKLGVGAHTIGEWTTFTPVFGNFTLGNGTVTAYYLQINELVIVSGVVVLGSTSSMGTSPTIVHPVGTAQNQTGYGGIIRLLDAGTINLKGTVQINATNVNLFYDAISSNRVTPATINSTAPFTWTTSDQFMFNYSYMKA